MRRADASAQPAEAMPEPEPANPNDPLAATSRNLQGYQRQLQGHAGELDEDRSARRPAKRPDTMPSGALLGGADDGKPGQPGWRPLPQGGLFGGQLQGSATPTVAAGLLGNRSLTMPKGVLFTCSLKTRVISATSGFVACQVQRNVFSDDGKVVLAERGSHLDGEYRMVRSALARDPHPGAVDPLRTPNGVTVDMDSPGTGQLGESRASAATSTTAGPNASAPPCWCR
jgi:type IV secretion system protein VirB10